VTREHNLAELPAGRKKRLTLLANKMLAIDQNKNMRVLIYGEIKKKRKILESTAPETASEFAVFIIG